MVKKKVVIFLSLLLSLLLLKDIRALSTENITFYNNDTSSRFSKIVTNVSSIEKLCAYWVPAWARDISKDSLKNVLYGAIEEINNSVETINLFDVSLFRGLLWHYLYQLEVDSGFNQANAIADELQNVYPDRIEGPWLKGINLVKASHLLNGFHILDSIRLSSNSLPNAFFQDYAKLSALALLPGQMQDFNSEILLSTHNKKSRMIQLNVDERTPQENNWKVISSTDTKNILPTFIFGAQFSLKKPIQLLFPNLGKQRMFNLEIPIDETLAKYVPQPLVFDPDAPPYKMELKIHVETKNVKSTLDRYVFDIVYKQYDEIKEVADLPNKNAIALKCYRRSLIKGIPGDYTAYYAFDRYLSNSSPHFYHSEDKNTKDTIIQLRYLVAMQTVQAVEEKADVLFTELFDRLQEFDK